MDQPIESFRSSFPRLAVVMTASSFYLGVAMFIADRVAEDGLNVDIRAMAVTVLIYPPLALPLAPILTAILVAYFRVYIYADGIRSYDFWGRYHYLQWSDIEMIRPINLLGFSYVRLYSNGKSPTISIPLFLVGIDRVKELVTQYAEPDNPLALYFEHDVA